MAKVEVIRKGGSKSVRFPQRTADMLVKGGRWDYVQEPKVSKPKRAPKAKHEASGDAPVAEPQAVEVEPQKKEEAEPAATRPMTAKVVAPTKRGMTSADLQAMSKADLKVLGQRLGADLLPSDSKEQFVQKILRYMRRDMRAER